MKKVTSLVIVISCVLCSLLSDRAIGQKNVYGWELGLGAGYMNYYGDMSPYQLKSNFGKIYKFWGFNQHYINRPSFSVTLEKRLTPGIALMLQANDGSFSMSDRYVKPNGNLMSDAPNWDRALNFKTHVTDAGAAFVFRSDNGKLLKETAFFAPYVFIGGGFTHFNVKGDLYDKDGDPYDYTGTEPIETDGVYETNLRPLITEDRAAKYANLVPYADLGLGFKFRVNTVLSISLQTDVKYAFSDYLDDLSGKYKETYPDEASAYAAHPGINVIGPDRKRGRDNGWNDFYIFNKASVNIAIGRKGGARRRNAFQAPVIYNPSEIISAVSKSEDEEQVLIDSSESKSIDDTSKIETKSDSVIQDRHSGHPKITILSYSDSTKVIIENNATKVSNIDVTGDTIYFRPDKISDQSLAQTYRDTVQENRRAIVLTENRVLLDSLETVRDSIMTSPQYQTGIKAYGLTYDTLTAGTITNPIDSIQYLTERMVQENIDGNEPVLTSSDSVYIHGLKSQIDSLQDANELMAARYNEAIQQLNNSSDSLHAIQLKRAVDSVKTVQDSLRFAYTDTLLQSIREKSQQSYADNRSQLVNDSSKMEDLRFKIDSLLRVQDDFTAKIDEAAQKNVSKKKDRKKQEQLQKAMEDSLRYQQILINNHNAEVNRLAKRVEDLRKQNERYYNNLSDIDDRRNLLEKQYRLQERYNKKLLENTSNRNISLAPVITPVPQNGSYEMNRQLSDINSKIEALYAQRDSLTTDSSRLSDSTLLTEKLVPAMKDSTSLSQRLQVDKDAQIAQYESQVANLELRIRSLENRLMGDSEPESVVKEYPVVSTYFKIGSAVLDPSQTDKLIPIGRLLNDQQSLSVILKSFTDATGSVAINKAVAQKRSQSVKSILVAKYHISESRIIIETPEISDSRSGSNALDRRVDVRLAEL